MTHKFRVTIRLKGRAWIEDVEAEDSGRAGSIALDMLRLEEEQLASIEVVQLEPKQSL